MAQRNSSECQLNPGATENIKSANRKLGKRCVPLQLCRPCPANPGLNVMQNWQPCIYGPETILGIHRSPEATRRYQIRQVWRRRNQTSQ